MEPLKLAWTLRRYPAARKGLIGASLMLSVIRAGVGLGYLVCIERLIDEVFIAGRHDRLGHYLLIYGAITLVKLAADYLFAWTDFRVTSGIELQAKTDVFNHALRLSPNSLRAHSSGDFLTCLSSDAAKVESLVYSGPLSALTNLLAGGAYLVFLFTLSWKLTLCALVIAPLLALASLRTSRLTRRRSRFSRRLSGEIIQAAEETFANLRLLHAFSAQPSAASRFARLNGLGLRAEARQVGLQANLGVWIELVGLGGALALMAVGAHDLRSGALSLGALMAFLGSVSSLYGPVRSLAKAWPRQQRAAIGAGRLHAFLTLKSEVAEAAAPVRLAEVRGEIELRDVRFAYRPDEPVLDGLSLRIAAGEHVAIVGVSGAGKSTLAHLLLRLQDPATGAIRLDGVDLRDLALADLRRAISVCFQDPMLLSGSISANIAVGRLGADARAVAEAARQAQAETFVERRPGGLLSRLGQRGRGLSGGQGQRIALARTLIGQAPVLVLDEATSALDGETEEGLLDAVAALGGARTLVTITHRLSSVQRADRVIVIDQGRVVESGPPSLLLAGPTRCRALFASQLAEIGRAA